MFSLAFEDPASTEQALLTAILIALIMGPLWTLLPSTISRTKQVRKGGGGGGGGGEAEDVPPPSPLFLDCS